MSIRLYTLILLAAMSSVNVAAGTSHISLMEAANQAYINENYHEAIALYEEIVDMQWSSAALYYNLGNAYYQAAQPGKAILNYERARRLNPNDEAVIHNLRILRSQLTDRQDTMPRLFFLEWHDRFIRLQSADAWARTVLVSVFLFVLTMALFLILKPRIVRKLLLYLAGLLLITIFTAYYAADRQYYINYVKQEAIIMNQRVTAKSAPGERGVDLFVMHEGTKVEVKTHLNSWYEVRLPNGNVGWIQETAIEII